MVVSARKERRNESETQIFARMYRINAELIKCWMNVLNRNWICRTIVVIRRGTTFLRHCAEEE
jgi:hypothetical protein